MHVPPLDTQLLSTSGAILCLIAYAGLQLKWMDPNKALYNLLNIFGSGILFYVAFRPFQAGFVIMEFVWALLSLFAFCKALLKSRK